MENVLLVIHLIFAIALIAIVLLQRSEGGGLGIGGGGASSGRPKASPLAKFTWFIALGFLIISIILTIIAAKNANDVSIVDSHTQSQGEDAPELPDGLDDNLLPPSLDDDINLIPKVE